MKARKYHAATITQCPITLLMSCLSFGAIYPPLLVLKEESTGGGSTSIHHHHHNSRNALIVMSDNRWNDPTHYLQGSSSINRAYAQRHGYGFFQCSNNDMTECKDSPPAHCKLHCLQRALDDAGPDTELLIYLDSDAVFRNFSMTIDSFIEENAKLSAGSSFDLIVPVDCDNYRFNSGVLLWNKSSTGANLILSEWINRTAKYPNFPWEQQALKHWYEEPNSTLASNKHFLSIDYGPETWHVGSCDRGQYIPPKFIAHIAGRWPDYRWPTMVDTALMARNGIPDGS